MTWADRDWTRSRRRSSGEDVRDWFGTKLGLTVFVGTMKRLASQEEYELLLRWASRREPHLRGAEIEWCEAFAGAVAELMERWEPVEVRAEERSFAESVGS